MQPAPPQAALPYLLTGRHFIITGAASGIGEATAALFDRLGARLSLIDVDAGRLAQAAGALTPNTHHCHNYDLADIAGIDALVRQVVEQGGLLNGVVHCAGVQSVAPAKILAFDNWRKIFAVNTEAGLALAKSLHSKKVYAGSDGAVVFISSVVGVVGSAGAIAYSMSKSALHGVARSMALEFAPRKIRVNCVAPGYVRTPLFDKTEKLWSEAQRAAVEAQHPLGFGQPADIANAVAFLAADTGRWITGSVMVVDGGYLAQ